MTNAKAIYSCPHGLRDAPCKICNSETFVTPSKESVIADKPSDSQIGGNHYKTMAIQPAEFIHRNDIGFLEGNVIKYVCRHAAKNGKDDLLKARHYIDLLLEWEYGK